MKPKYFFLFLFLSFYILNSTFSIATVRYVSKTGTSTYPYTSWETAATSIQLCINVCVDGDTIYVANGVYKENLVINTAISLIGSSMDSTVIDGKELANYTILSYDTLKVSYFTVIGKGENTSSTGCFQYRNPLFVNDCIIKETELGFGAVNAKIVSINNILKDLRGGYYLSGSDTSLIENCIVIVNELEDATGLSIGFAPGGIFNIYNNIILFSGTVNSGSGISIGAPKKIIIRNNLISGFTPNVYFDSIFDTSYIYQNLSNYSNSNIGSIFLRSSSMVVENNIFNNNKAGLRVYNDPIHKYNLYWKNQTNILDGSLNDSDIVVDPMFVKDTVPAANGGYDFHLQAYSPAIDKGDPNILDLDGTRSDIGMYGGPFGEIYTYQDLAPLAPRNLSAVIDSNYITVRWNRNTEADTAFYKVYRDTVINFTIDSTKLVSSSSDTFFVQVNPHSVSRFVYKVTCVDNQGKESLPSSELVVNITSVSMDDYPMTISDYVLYQNYPNPFNPSTKIGYQLKQRAYVKLMVYDIKGELVSVLVNKEQNAGYYEAEFVGNGLPSVPNTPGLASGIYLYRIEVIGEVNIPVYTEMKKMLLIK